MLSEQQIKTITTILNVNNKIDKVWVFGSFARNEETANSDVDLLFTVKDGKNFGLLEMIRLIDTLEASLGKKVDFIKEGSLLPFALESANRDKIQIYG